MSSPLAILVDFGWLYVSSGLKYISHVSLMSLCILESGIIVRLLIKRLMWKCCRYILVAKGIRTMCVLIYEVICNPSCWSYLPSWMKRKFKSKVLKLKFTFTNSWREEGKKKILIINERKKESSPPRRGIEPRSPAWQAGILTTILPRTWYQISGKLQYLFIVFLSQWQQEGDSQYII